MGKNMADYRGRRKLIRACTVDKSQRLAIAGVLAAMTGGVVLAAIAGLSWDNRGLRTMWTRSRLTVFDLSRNCCGVFL